MIRVTTKLDDEAIKALTDLSMQSDFNKKQCKHFWLWMVICALFLSFVLIPKGRYVGFLICVAVLTALGFLFKPFYYCYIKRIVNRRASELINKEIQYTIDEKGIIRAVDHMTVKLDWAAIKEWTIFSDYYFIKANGKTFMLFDAALLSEADRDELMGYLGKTGQGESRNKAEMAKAEK